MADFDINDDRWAAVGEHDLAVARGHVFEIRDVVKRFQCPLVRN